MNSSSVDGPFWKWIIRTMVLMVWVVAVLSMSEHFIARDGLIIGMLKSIAWGTIAGFAITAFRLE